jgi:hypothetical protein
MTSLVNLAQLIEHLHYLRRGSASNPVILLIHLKGLFGCGKTIIREKEVRESLRREKYVRVRVDLIHEFLE